MTRKLLFVLRHEEPMDDLQFISSIVKSGVAKVKILLMNETYLFRDISLDEINSMDGYGNVTITTAERMRELSEDYIRAELKFMLEHGVEICYDKRLKEFEKIIFSNTDFRENKIKYGKIHAFMNSGIKRLNPFKFVTDAIAQGYEIIKW